MRLFRMARKGATAADLALKYGLQAQHDAMAACSRRDSLRNPRGEATRSILEVPRIPISIVGELKVDSLGGVGGRYRGK